MPGTLASTRAATIALLQAPLAERGIDFAQFIADAGVAVEAGADPNQLVDLNTVMLLFQRAAVATGDPMFGVTLAGRMTPGGSGLAGALMMYPSTVREAVASLIDTLPAHSPGVSGRLTEGDGFASIDWRYPRSLSAHREQYVMFVCASFMTRLRASSGRNFQPLSVRFEHATADPGAYAAFFGPKVSFSQTDNAIVLDPAIMSLPLVTANPALYAMAMDVARRWMEEGQVPDLVRDVKREIESRLERGTPTLDVVSRALKLTSSQLQWRLEQSGTTFERAVGEVRADVAAHLLRNTDEPMAEIAFRLGFSDQSTFTRAARRWFQVPPATFRRQARRLRVLGADKGSND